jgi:MFS family permease
MTEASSEAAGRLMERYRLQLITGIALCGVLIAMLSFAPWVRFHSISDELTTPGAPEASVRVRGTHLSRYRDEESLLQGDVKNENGWCSCRVSTGDGYLTAALGVLVMGVAAAAYSLGRDRSAGIVGVAAALGALGVAGYNAIGKWQAYVWTDLQALEVTKGAVQVWLWLLVAVAAIGAVLAGLLWGAGAEEVHDELLAEEEEEEWEEIAEKTDQYWEPHGGGPPSGVS